jgi:hypothetical protein
MYNTLDACTGVLMASSSQLLLLLATGLKNDVIFFALIVFVVVFTPAPITADDFIVPMNE